MITVASIRIVASSAPTGPTGSSTLFAQPDRPRQPNPSSSTRTTRLRVLFRSCSTLIQRCPRVRAGVRSHHEPRAASDVPHRPRFSSMERYRAEFEVLAGAVRPNPSSADIAALSAASSATLFPDGHPETKKARPQQPRFSKTLATISPEAHQPQDERPS